MSVCQVVLRWERRSGQQRLEIVSLVLVFWTRSGRKATVERKLCSIEERCHTMTS